MVKQFVDNLPTNFLSVFDHFVKLGLKGLTLLGLGGADSPPPPRPPIKLF